MTPAEIKVALPGRAYSIWVGAGLLGRAAEFVPVPDGAEIVAVVTDANVRAAHGARAREGLAAAGLRVEEMVLHAGEETKSLAQAESVLHWLAGIGAHRRDVVAALGGGVVGDLAGFAAAIFNRGVPLVHLPTTLVAQVDAAIGGKTGVNLPAGKNLVGTFHQPLAVIADVEALRTLPKGEFTSGLAEVAKHGFIADAEILTELRRGTAAVGSREPDVLTSVVARAAAVKARIVEQDETEQGIRAFLNYGHTLAHALEALGGYKTWRHGDAVAVGMMFAAHLGAFLGYADLVREHYAVLSWLGLATKGAGAEYDVVVRMWRHDKKYRKGMRFVVLEELGRPAIVSDVPEETLRRAYEAVR